MATVLSTGSSSSGTLESLGFDEYHRRDSALFPESTASQITDLDLGGELIEYVYVSSLLAGEISVDQNIRGGQTAYDAGTGFWLGLDGTTAKFSLGNSAGNKLTWDGSTLSIVGTLTATSGTIGGWTINATSITDAAGVVGMSSAVTGADDIRFWAGDVTPGSAEFRVYESGALVATSATITGAITATSGDIGGWVIVSGYIYNLQSGTPTATPNDGVVLASGNEAIIIYEDTAKRVELGYLSAGVYGLKGYATDGSTILFELSDAQNSLSGLTVASTSLAVSTNIIIDSSGKAFSINSATFATDGIQLQYNAGNPRAYIGNGSTYFFNFDGTNISWGAVNTTLDTAGKLTTTSAAIGGWDVVSGYIYNLQSGTPTSSPNDGVVLASGNEALIVYEDTAKRVEVGYLASGIYGIKAYATDGSTVIFEASDTQQKMAGWIFDETYLYGLSSGTPTATPNDGLVLKSGATAVVTAYEGTAKRVELGYLSAAVFGLKGYATNGTTVVFELSDTQQRIAGWYFTDTLLRSGTADATSNVLIDSANSLIRLGPTAGDYLTLDGANLRIRSSNYSSGAFGAGFTLEPDLLEVGNASIRGRIQMATFVASSISAVNGDIVVAVGSDTLDADTTALDASTITITGDMTLAVNDRIRLKEGLEDEWMVVTNIGSAPTYTVTRDSASAYAANTNPVWTKGATVVNFGQSGDGGVFITANDTNAPFVSVYTHAGSPWSAMTTRLRLGNLNGYLGYAADIYGLGVGSSTAGEANITIEPTNGLRIRTGTTTLFQVDNAGNATIGGWTLDADEIKDAAGVVGMSSAVTGSDDIRFWAGDATPASAEFRVYESGALVASSATITGAITATSGAIGGWVVTASDIKDAAGTVGMSSAVTGGDDIRFFAGNVTPGSAPFRVTEAGVLVASSATITGAITATSGAIGGWVVTSDAIKDAAGTVGMLSTVTGGDDIRFYAGDATPGSAEFRVYESGALVASSATITGTITATAGAIGGFSIGADYVRDAADSFGLASTVTGGDDIRFWAGDTFANRATAPFSVSEAGVLTATSAIIEGELSVSANDLTSGHLIENGAGVAVGSDSLIYHTRINSVTATATAAINTNTVTTGGAGNMRFFDMSDTVKVILTSCGSSGGGANARSRIYRAAITPTTTSSATVTNANLSGTTEFSSDAVKINATTLFTVNQVTTLAAAGILVTGLDTTITVNSPTTLSTAARGITCAYYSSTKAVVFFHDNTTNEIKALAPTWSGTTITAGSETVLSTETANTYVLSCVQFGTSQYYLLVYQETSANDLLCRVVSFNGSTFSVGSAVTISATSGFSNYQSMSTVSVDDTYATISYNDNGTAKVAVVSHSGTVASVNSATSFGTAQANVAVHSYAFGKYTHTLSFLSGATTISTYVYDVDGIVITQLGSALSTTTSGGGSQSICGRWNPTTGLLMYFDTTTTNRHEMDSITFSSNYSTYFGVAQETIASAAYGKISYLGYAVMPAATGLSAAQIYYVDTDGAYSLYNVSQGRAFISISATSVAIK